MFNSSWEAVAVAVKREYFSAKTQPHRLVVPKIENSWFLMYHIIGFLLTISESKHLNLSTKKVSDGQHTFFYICLCVCENVHNPWWLHSIEIYCLLCSLYQRCVIFHCLLLEWSPSYCSWFCLENRNIARHLAVLFLSE